MFEVYSKIEIIEAVRQFLEKRGFEVRPAYDPIFEPARVPIFASSKEGEVENQVFVDIITERRITCRDYFKRRDFGRSLEGSLTIHNASSAQFFRHYFPLAQVFWAIPSYLEKNDEFALFCEKCKDANVGLFEVTKGEAGDFSVTEINTPPLSLLEERIQSLLNELSHKVKKHERDTLSASLRRYCEEDISYLVFYPEPKYLATDISVRDHEFSISRELINKMGDLKNVSYRDKLLEFSKSYFQKAEDDYKIALEITRNLWSEYNLELPKLHLDFESILKLDPRYRDHFLHAFQVFLFGVYVIDCMYSEVRGGTFQDEKGQRIEDAWLFAATYHDFNYMVQKFEEWTKAFFRNALHLDEKDKSPASLHLSESYVKKGYMFNTKRLTKMFSMGALDHVDLDFFYDRILEKKNHGLISSLSLMKYLDIKIGHDLKDSVTNAACKAIAIHDRGIWQYLCGMAADDPNDQSGSDFNKKKVISDISFSKDPIPFLLVLIDSMQEDGRSRDDRLKVELEKLEYEGGKIYCEVSFKGNKSDEAFSSKKKELKSVSQFLEGEDKFIVLLTNISDNIKDSTSITI